MSEVTTKKASSKIWLTLAKIAIAVLIVGFLVAKIDRQTIDYLRSHPARWNLLSLGLLWVLVAHLITYVRWWQLVVSLGVPMPLLTAIRVGFLGTMFNLITVGAIGGDLFKAIIATRTARHKMPEIIASVLVDRIVGLIGLILVTSVAFESYPYLINKMATLPKDLQFLRLVCLVSAIASVAGLITLACLGKHFPAHWFAKLPVIGSMASRIAAVAHILHGRPFLLMVQIGMSVGVHLSLTFGFYSVSMAFYDQAPGLLEHLIAIPPAFAIAALPLTPGGIGLFEAAVVQMMQAVAQIDATFEKLLVVILAVYRVLLTLIAGIGGVYYLFGFGKLAKSEESLAADLSIDP